MTQQDEQGQQQAANPFDAAVHNPFDAAVRPAPPLAPAYRGPTGRGTQGSWNVGGAETETPNTPKPGLAADLASQHFLPQAVGKLGSLAGGIGSFPFQAAEHPLETAKQIGLSPLRVAQDLPSAVQDVSGMVGLRGLPVSFAPGAQLSQGTHETPGQPIERFGGDLMNLAMLTGVGLDAAKHIDEGRAAAADAATKAATAKAAADEAAQAEQVRLAGQQALRTREGAVAPPVRRPGTTAPEAVDVADQTPPPSQGPTPAPATPDLGAALEPDRTPPASFERPVQGPMLTREMVDAREANPFDAALTPEHMKIGPETVDTSYEALTGSTKEADFGKEPGAPDLPKAAEPLRARTPAGNLMSFNKATDEQMQGEYRALIDARAAARDEVASGQRTFEGVGEQGGMVSTKGGMRAGGRVYQLSKSIEKVEAELTRRGIDHFDAYEAGGKPGGASPPKPEDTSFDFGANAKPGLPAASLKAAAERAAAKAFGGAQSFGRDLNDPGRIPPGFEDLAKPERPASGTEPHGNVRGPEGTVSVSGESRLPPGPLKAPARGGSAGMPPLPLGTPRGEEASDLLNRERIEPTDEMHADELTKLIDDASFEGTDKTEISMADQKAHSDKFVKQILAYVVPDLDHQKVMRMSGPELKQIEDRLNTNAKLSSDLDAEIAKGKGSPSHLTDLASQRDALREQAKQMIDALVLGKGQKGRDLGYLKNMARVSTDPAVWLQEAKRALGLKNLTDEMQSAVIKLANAAKEACSGE